MRKKPFTETEVLFNKTPSGIRTSDLGDSSLSLLQRATKAEPLTDRDGKQLAYDHGDSYMRGDTMYVAGSHTKPDWYDDVTIIPLFGDLRERHRYKEADQMLKANLPIHNIGGHSLGVSVAHELRANHPGLRSVT